MANAKVIIDASERDSDLLYATDFVAGDPFTYVEIDGRSHLILSDLEYGRGRQESSVDEVVPFSDLETELSQAGKESARIEDVLMHFLRKNGVSEVVVPMRFPVGYADRLRADGFDVQVQPDPFFPQRVVKRQAEIQHIQNAQAATEEVMLEALDALRRAEVKDGELSLDGAPLTVERLKRQISRSLLDRGYAAKTIIVAPGDQGCDPHNAGSGPIHPGESIILDIFPRGIQSHYWGDMTRTVCKGPASEELQAVYQSVKRAQEMAVDAIRPGVTGAEIHRLVQQCFDEDGFVTERKNGTWCGFFHGTGHGVGLDIHEGPRLSREGPELKEGMVVTVEPGLYYPGIGAVRIEDIAVVTAEGCDNLNRAPKELCI